MSRVPAPAAEVSGLDMRAAPAVGVVFALRAESGGLEDLLSGVVVNHAADFAIREGELHGRRVLLVDSGVGRQHATRAAELLIAGHRPRWVISAGFCGGLSDNVARNDVIVADGALNHDEGGRVTSTAVTIPPPLAPLLTEPGIHTGRLITADRILAKPADKRACGAETGAVGVDMETWGVLQACRAAGIGFLAVRVVSDAINDELPADVEHLARQTSGPARVGAALRAIFHRPSSVKDMWKLKETALVASDRLAKFLARAIEALLPATTEEQS